MGIDTRVVGVNEIKKIRIYIYIYANDMLERSTGSLKDVNNDNSNIQTNTYTKPRDMCQDCFKI